MYAFISSLDFNFTESLVQWGHYFISFFNLKNRKKWKTECVWNLLCSKENVSYGNKFEICLQTLNFIMIGQYGLDLSESNKLS